MGVKLSVHPLFFAFGFYFALTGRIFIFLTYTVCAVIHELGHSIVASKNGFRLNKITLMPFGATVEGGGDDMPPKEEIKIALAGPFTNLAVGLFFVAMWWIFPSLYAFTDIAVEASFALAIVNFIPIYPLDGGRVTFALLRSRMSRNKAIKICKITGVCFSAILFALFIVSLFFQANISLLFFALFAFVGTVEKKKENVYIRLFSGVIEERLKRGATVRKIAVDKSVTVKKLTSLLDVETVNEVEVYEKGEKIATLSQKKLGEIVLKGEIYSPIEKFL